MRWDELCQTTGRLGAASFRESVPRRDGLGVLTWYAGRRGALPAVRGPRGALGRPARSRDGRHRPAPRPRRGARRGASRAATGAGRRPARPCPGSPRPAGSWPGSPTAGPSLVLRGPGLDDADVAPGRPRSGAGADGRPARARRVDRPRARAGALPASPAGPGRPPGARPRRGRRRRRHERDRVSAAPAELVELVRDRLAREPGDAHAAPGRRGPARAPADRSATPPCSRSTRRCAATSSAPDRSSRCCGCPASPTSWSTGPTQVYVDRGAGLERTRGAVRRRRGRTAARAAAGRRGRAAARRRHPVRRRPAGRRHPLPRGAGAGRPPGHRACRCASRAARRSPSTTWCGAGTLTDEGARLLPSLVAAPAGLPGHRRHRRRQDDAAREPAVAGRPGRAAGRWSRTPPSCDPTIPTSSGSRRGRPTSRAPARSTVRDAGAAGAADAARPAGRRRGAGRLGDRPARRAQHRPRGRLRHPPRQLGRSTSPPGSRRSRWRPGGVARPRTASSPPRSTSVVHLDRAARRSSVAARGRRARAGRRRAGVPACRRSTFDDDGAAAPAPAPAPRRLDRRLARGR